MVHINIFDTTLRDGEQSPGVNLNQPESLKIANPPDKFDVKMIWMSQKSQTLLRHPLPRGFRIG